MPTGIRVAYPPTVTTQASARLSLAGTTSKSLLSGTVTITDVALHSQSDMGSFLNSAAAPPPPESVSTGLMAGMRFDVKIQTSPDVQFRTALTENLQANANLTLRGDADHPGMIGRVIVTQGDVVFSGTKYTIDQGTVTFTNPRKIEPVLNIDLATTVQGVDVSLTFSGRVDRMKLSYRSDPPLQFTEIVSLLGSGKPPTSDPCAGRANSGGAHAKLGADRGVDAAGGGGGESGVGEAATAVWSEQAEDRSANHGGGEYAAGDVDGGAADLAGVDVHVHSGCHAE